MHSRVLWYFHIGLFVISRVMGVFFSNLTFIFNIKSWNVDGVSFSHASALIVSMLFRRRVWRHWLSKNGLLSCHCKCCHMLFLLICSMSVVVWWFVVGSRFFFLLSTLLSLLVKVHICPFFFLFFNFSHYVFCCLFSSLTLLENFLRFQFSL
jgi:hypothetical protein